MGEENETEVEKPKDDEVVEAITEEIKKGDLTHDDLEALEKKLLAHINSIRSDKTKDAEEKAETNARLEKLQEHLDHLINAQEERDRKTNDESTIVVPAADLDPPTHQNVNEEDARVQQENQAKPKSKKGLRWW